MKSAPLLKKSQFFNLNHYLNLDFPGEGLAEETQDIRTIKLIYFIALSNVDNIVFDVLAISYISGSWYDPSPTTGEGKSRHFTFKNK